MDTSNFITIGVIAVVGGLTAYGFFSSQNPSVSKTLKGLNKIVSRLQNRAKECENVSAHCGTKIAKLSEKSHEALRESEQAKRAAEKIQNLVS